MNYRDAQTKVARRIARREKAARHCDELGKHVRASLIRAELDGLEYALSQFYRVGRVPNLMQGFEDAVLERIGQIDCKEPADHLTNTTRACVIAELRRLHSRMRTMIDRSKRHKKEPK